MSALSPVIETPVAFAGANGARIGIATAAARIADSAVLIVPATSETRTGPERLYVRLARELARAGLPSLRFDPADGGDSRPDSPGGAPEDDIAAAARRLLALYPDSFVTVLAVGRAAAGAARAWQGLAERHVPLSALCLIDPVIALQATTARSGWWRRMFGGGDGSRPQGHPGAHVDDGAHGVDATHAWKTLPQTVRAARSKLLVITRSGGSSSLALAALTETERAWRKALRQSREWLQVEGVDAGFGDPGKCREIGDWLATRIAR